VLERGIRREGAHDAAVARALDEVRPDAQVATEERALEADAAGLSEHDAGLPSSGRGDVHLGLGLAVGDEEVVGRRRGLHRLPVLPRESEADLAEAGGRADPEGLPPELALPGFEDEGLTGPASLRMADITLAEGCELGPPERLSGTTRSSAGHGKVVPMSLALRNLVFTVVVPGTVTVYLPGLILTAGGVDPQPVVWPAAIVVALGAALYLWCLWLFATVGRGTPGPWDAPRQAVVVGPYAWVRNPIYLAVFLVVAGEALLFLSVPLLAYLAVFAIGAHLFVVGYEEPTLTERFGEEYEAYRRRVPRWIPRPPRAPAA
jgi:protein-S-isoprenylcysteine O-methyltransferase Ste14